MTKGQVINASAKAVSQICFQMCTSCKSREKCFKDTSGVPKTIDFVMKTIDDHKAAIASAATIELIKMMKQHMTNQDK